MGVASSIFSKNSGVNWGCYLKEETRSQLMQWINEDFEQNEIEAGDHFIQDELESLLRLLRTPKPKTGPPRGITKTELQDKYLDVESGASHFHDAEVDRFTQLAADNFTTAEGKLEATTEAEYQAENFLDASEFAEAGYEFEPYTQQDDFHLNVDEYAGDYETEDAAIEGEVFTHTEEYKDESERFEEFVPKVSETDLRKRIDEYFDLANAEYILPDKTKVKARPQFHIAKVGDPEQDAQRVENILMKKFGAKFSKPLHDAIRCAAYGRVRPDEIKLITQALINAGELDAVRSDHSGLSDNQLVRALQEKFNIGIDCAGYVQLAFIYAFTGNHDNARCNLNSLKLREDLGLNAKRSWENLAYLPKKHFIEVGFLNGKTGDLLVLAWRKRERDWHTVIVVDHTVSGDLHTFVVDASWGFLYGEDAAGVARRKFMYDRSTGKWWDNHPIAGTKVNENSIGPYKEHPIKGMYRAKQK